LAIIKTPAKTLVGGVSKNKKIRERVDSEGQYGRWRLRVMGSCCSLDFVVQREECRCYMEVDRCHEIMTEVEKYD